MSFEEEYKGIDRRSGHDNLLRDMLSSISRKLEKMENDLSALHASIIALHMWKADVNSAFPNENFSHHHEDHVEYQTVRNDRKEIILEIKKKVISGAFWAALVFGAYSVYDKFLVNVTTAAKVIPK
jgi:hypothetical protein